VNQLGEFSESRIYSVLTDIFRDVFRNPALSIDPDTDADHIKEWDSFAQVNIIVAAEDRFGVRFRAAEAYNLKSVAALVKALQGKLP
jgi:acyl carrier protein